MINDLNWRKISDQLSTNLIQTFAKNKIFACLKMLENDKTPGPDGFTMELFRKFWNIFKSNIMNLFQDFFQKSIVNKAMNATYIAFIPKKLAPQKVSNYILINLTTNIYKILAKVLVECLKHAMPATISPNLSAFVKGRQITDSILIANEIVDLWRCNKQKGYIIKLDVEKAFDKLN